MKSISVIGGGIVGLATAYRLSERFPGVSVTVLEKEHGVGQHQTGHNSGVLHCGLYYKPGSFKAQMAVKGIRQMIAFCQENDIPHEICGKLVVAVDATEAARLRDLHDRGQQNGLNGLRWLNKEEIAEFEPHCGGVAALRVPEEGIVDYARVCEVLVTKIRARGDRVVTGARVTTLRRAADRWVAETTAGSYESDVIVNCAGLHCDRVSEMGGLERQTRIVPFRGEYYKIRPERQYLVRHLIYPVPDPKFPFLGVHFTRLIHGGIEAGPNAVLAFAREGYRKSDIDLGDLWDAVTYSGMWSFLRRYPKTCWDELRRSFSRKLFCRSLQRLVPEIEPRDLVAGGAGVRAQALAPNGDLIQDFQFALAPGAVHVINAPSPGATASLAIGASICERVADVAGPR